MTVRLDAEQVVDLSLVPGRRRHERGEGRVPIGTWGKLCLYDVEQAAAGQERADHGRTVSLRGREETSKTVPSTYALGDRDGESLRIDPFASWAEASCARSELCRRPLQ